MKKLLLSLTLLLFPMGIYANIPEFKPVWQAYNAGNLSLAHQILVAEMPQIVGCDPEDVIHYHLVRIYLYEREKEKTKSLKEISQVQRKIADHMEYVRTAAARGYRLIEK